MRTLESAPTPGAEPKYRIVREIASGGMATVYLAERPEGERPREVAIKRLHAHLAKEEEFVAMFFDEARLAAQIRHPNVVGVLDVDQRDALSIVMEYVQGVTFLDLTRDQSRRGFRLPHPVAGRIALDTLSGLHAAHELRDSAGQPLHIVHRDASPHNILVGVDGISRITDFGIAKATTRLSTTRDGQTKGKLAYMAPEQFEFGELDRRVDIFAVGLVLWEVFTGRRLFKGASEAAVINALLHADLPRMRSIDDTLPEALDAVIMKAMARRPEDRWATCAAFAVALRKVLVPAPRAEVGLLAAQAYEHFLADQRDPTGKQPSASDVRAIVAPREREEVSAEMAVDEEPTGALSTLPEFGSAALAGESAEARTEIHPWRGAAAAESLRPLAVTAEPEDGPSSISIELSRTDLVSPPDEVPASIVEPEPEPGPSQLPTMATRWSRRIGLVALLLSLLSLGIWQVRGRAAHPITAAPTVVVSSTIVHPIGPSTEPVPAEIVLPSPAPPVAVVPAPRPTPRVAGATALQRRAPAAAPTRPVSRPPVVGAAGLSRTSDGRIFIR